MKSLYPKTLEALADLICGDNGPIYRKGYEIPKFFRSAGINCVDHDGSTRKWWTLDRLKEYNSQPLEMSKIILRLADPKEYSGDPTPLNNSIKRLNVLLAPEGMRIFLDSANPRIQNIEPTILPAEEKKIYAITTPDFLKISNDKELSEILERRWKEVKICIEGEAFLSSIVMMGGILEGLFLSIVTQYSREANKSKCSPKDKRGKVKKFGDWKLSEFINVAYDLGWIQSDAKDFSSSLRCYRNLIHPYEQRLMAHYPDEDTAKICLQVIQATINDLLTHIDNINKEVKGN